MLCVRFERRSKSDDRGNARCAQQRQGGCRTSTMAALAARLNASFTRSTPPLVPPPTIRLGPLQNSEKIFPMAFWVLAGSPFSAKVSTFLISHTAPPCPSWRTTTSTVLIPEILICSVTTKLRDFIFQKHVDERYRDRPFSLCGCVGIIKKASVSFCSVFK